MVKTASNKSTARLAGFLYLGVVLSGILPLAYIPSKLVIRNDPDATFQSIVSSEPLFRYGIASGAVCYLFFLLLPLALYKLFRPIHAVYAKLMVLLVAISVCMSFLNLQNQFTILSLLNGRNNLSGLTPNQVQSQVLFCLAQYNNGIQTVEVFWGLWLLPFGYLVFASRMLPRILGVLLMLGCFGYLIDFFGYAVLVGYSKTAVSSYLSWPGRVGEIGTCLWLLVIGAKDSVQVHEHLPKLNPYEI